VMAVATPSFAVTVERVAVAAPLARGATTGPDLVSDPNGPAWLVTQSASAAAVQSFWQILGSPVMNGP